MRRDPPNCVSGRDPRGFCDILALIRATAAKFNVGHLPWQGFDGSSAQSEVKREREREKVGKGRMDGWKGGDVRIDLRRKHGTSAFFDFGVDFCFSSQHEESYVLHFRATIYGYIY